MQPGPRSGLGGVVMGCAFTHHCRPALDAGFGCFSASSEAPPSQTVQILRLHAIGDQNISLDQLFGAQFFGGIGQFFFCHREG
jgi:hypothetical protein